jgi:hypothetical protein
MYGGRTCIYRSTRWYHGPTYITDSQVRPRPSTVSYLRYLCLVGYIGVHHIVLLLFCFSLSCVPYFASFSGLFIFDCLSLLCNVCHIARAICKYVCKMHTLQSAIE